VLTSVYNRRCVGGGAQDFHVRPGVDREEGGDAPGAQLRTVVMAARVAGAQ
jgi:hypothetical protein